MAKREQLTYEQFQRDIAKHELTIIKDDGVYRHIKCAIPDSYTMHFQVLTFPGYLVYVGDMGSFTFWRTDDMFAFFRNDDGRINPGYWSKKLEAVDRCDGHKEFSVESFHENVLSAARDSLELEDDAELPEDVKGELSALLSAEDEYECVQAIRDFSSERFDCTDFWGSNCEQYTGRFLWCCYALVWAINRYDEAKGAVTNG
jgi:hypothetical protein